MSAVRQLGERIVAAARPGWKDFKKDIERLGDALIAACKSGEISKDLAQRIHLDVDNALSAPLQRRYIAQGAFDPLIAFHRKRAGFQLPGWPDECAEVTLQALVEHGRAADAVALVREHFDRRLKHLRKHVQTRYRRGPRRQMDEQMKAALESLSQAVVDDIPAEKAELLRDLQRLAPLLEEHGGEAGHSWFAAIVREVWRERR